MTNKGNNSGDGGCLQSASFDWSMIKMIEMRYLSILRTLKNTTSPLKRLASQLVISGNEPSQKAALTLFFKYHPQKGQHFDS